MKHRLEQEHAFTLIELLVVIAIVGVLSGLGITSFSVYRSSAAYASADSTMRNARTTVEAALNDIDNPPAAVPLTVINQSGPVPNGVVADYLRGLVLPRNIKVQVSYDPTCDQAACQSDFLQVNHCLGNEHLRWVRFGDGVFVLMTHLAGGGC